MNETVKTLLISLSCVLADFAGVAVVAFSLLKKWKKISDHAKETKEELKEVRKELVQSLKKMNELNESVQWFTQSNEELKLELRGIKSHGSNVKKN